MRRKTIEERQRIEKRKYPQDALIKVKNGENKEANKAFEQLIPVFTKDIFWLMKGYGVPGEEPCDTVNSILIAIRYKIIPTWDSSKAFYPYFRVCVKNILNSRIKQAMQESKGGTHNIISLQHPLVDDFNILDTAVGSDSPADSRMMEEERLASIKAFLAKHYKRFTELERQVANHIMQGKTYSETAAAINKHFKAVDNARHRLGVKIRIEEYAWRELNNTK